MTPFINFHELFFIRVLKDKKTKWPYKMAVEITAFLPLRPSNLKILKVLESVIIDLSLF